MALTTESSKMVTFTPHAIGELELSGLTAGTTETLTPPSGVPQGVSPDQVTLETTTVATDGSPVIWAHTATSTGGSTTTRTVSVKFDTVAGGSLDGAKVKVRFHYVAQAAGGIS